MIRLRQVFIVFVTIFSIVFTSQAATFTVSNTNDSGAGSLRQALSDAANTTGGPHTINFTIASGSTININSSLAIYNDTDFNGLTINGFIDNVAGPDVIIRGNSGTVCNGIKGFEISAPITGLKIYGLVFQNLEYGIHYQANNKGTVLNSEIKGCYFGTNLTGSAIQDGICKSGIELDRASSVIVGGLATITAGGVANLERNVFGGTCNENNAGEINKYAAVSIEDCNNTLVQGNYIGVNAAGTARLAIGNLTLRQPPNRHGIFQTSNSASTRIDKNIISGAVGSGIYVNGGNNGIVTGNIIGLDASGTLGFNVTTPDLSFGNEAAGIYLKQVNGWLVGYNGGTAADERNVISANGGAIHTWGTCDFGWDFTNQQGIYTEGVNNTIIRGNYIGTNTAGTNAGQTATNLIYNRAGGVKITGEGNGASTNNVIGGTGANDKNVISNHGLFWGDKNTLNTRCGNVTFNTYDGGNGLVIQHDNTTSNRVEGNYIGLAADGISALGNTTSGIEIQGARSNTIGGSTAAQRNYISGNTYGVRFMEDFSNTHDRAQNNNVYGNWIGLNINGASVGNGQSVTATDGAGVLLEMGSNNNNIGGANSGEGNVISGNRSGVIIRNDEINSTGPAFSNSIVGNIIGMNPTLTAAIPNTSSAGGYGHGIQITMGSRGTVFPYGNIIGGATTAARNIIAGNQKSGVYITHSAAVVSTNAGNQIIGNFIGTANGTTANANGQNGIEILNVSGLNPTTGGTIIRGNLISGNTQNGISLNNSDYNTIQTNVIGGTAAITPAALANGQNGITLTNGSSNNIIGGVAGTIAVPTELNFIGFNTANGVNISGAASNRNSIHRNTFQCNALRGIELNGTGNNNYLRPTITGSPASINVTGPNGSTIELYATDGCATCAANGASNLRLQGRVLVAVGPSPLTFTPTAGVTYTAIAHEANTTADHNSSEFSDCYSLCSQPAPAIAQSGTRCENTTGVVFSTTNNSGNTYVWSVPSGVTITAGSGTNSITVSIGAAPITGSIQVTESAGAGCSGNASVTLNIKANPTTSNAGAAQSICGSSVTLAGNTPTVGSGTWTVSPSTGVTITNPNASNTTATGLTQGTNYTFTWTITNAPCSASSSNVVITNKQNPTVANAGTNQPICGSTYVLAGNTPTIGTGTWTVSPSTGVTIANPNAANSSVSGLSQGVDYTFTWTIANSPCTASSSNVVITNKQNPTVANAGTNQPICGSTYVLAGNTPTIGTGTWTVSPSTGVTIANPNAANSSVSGLSQGVDYTFTWTIANSPCTASSSNVVITNKQNPTVANAGTNQPICGSTYVLAGNTPTIGTGTWTVSPSTGVTIANPNAANSSVSGLSQGVDYTFTWTIANSPCTASSSNVVITNKQNPTVANAGTNQPICGSTYVLAGNTPTIGTGTWTVSPSTGVTIANPNAANSSVSGLSQGVDYTFTWTIANSPCTASSSNVVITNKQNPTVANAGTNQPICGSTYVLAGNTPTIGTGTWTVSPSTGVTIANPNAANSSVSGLSQGVDYTFTWTIANSPCTASSSNVVITNKQNPTVANAGTNQPICGSTYVLAGNTPTIGTGTWTVSPSTGVTIANPNAANSSVSGLSQGVDYTFTWTIANSPCTASSSNVVITNKQNPTVANAGTNQPICGSTYVLAGNTPTIGTGTWTVSPSTGVTIANPNAANSSVSGLSQGVDYTFTWTIANSPCTASSSNVVITNKQNPTVANAGTNQPICGSTYVLAGNTPTIGTGTWTVSPSTGVTIANPNAANSSVSGLSQGVDYTFTWTIANSPCTASSSNVVITNKQNPTVANAGTNQPICGSTYVLAGNTPTIGTGTWTVSPSTGVTITSPNSASSTATGLTAGTDYTFTWTIANSPCTASTSNVTIRTDVQPSAAVAGPDLIGCQITSGTLSATNPTTGTATWKPVAGLTFADPTSPTTTVTGIVAGQEYTVTWEVKGPLGVCTATSDDIIVRSDLNPTNVSAGNDTTLCNTGTVVLTAGGSPGTWSVASGTATIASPSSNSSSITIDGTTATLRWTVTSGTCSAGDDIVVSRTDLATPEITGIPAQCASSTGVNLTATPDVSGTGGSYAWEIVSGDVTITSATNVNPVEISTGLTGGEIRVKVTSGGCIDLPATTVISIRPDVSEAIAGIDFITCKDSVVLTGNTPTVGTPSWTVINQPSVGFTPGANNTEVKAGPLVIGTVYEFVYTITDAVCNQFKDDTVTVTAGITGFALVDVTGPSDTLCATTARSLTAIVTGGSGNFTFNWFGDNGFTATTTNPTISVVPNVNLVNYQVYVVDNVNIGCQTGTDGTIIHAVQKQNLEIMNLVTPNNDDKNDIFIVRDKDTYQDLIPEGSFLEVYNRWGDRVFKAQDYRNNWKCDELSDGMYYYYLKTGCGDVEYKGWVHILGNTNN